MTTPGANPAPLQPVAKFSRKRAGGVACPRCGGNNHTVLATWQEKSGNKTRRARRCLFARCGYEFTTSEVAD